MVEAVIEAVRLNVVTDAHVVLLKELDGSRVVPVWIGPSEAQAIAIQLQGQEVPRPLTHDLLRVVISQLGATVERVVVSDLRDGTFIATIVLNLGGRELEVDSRTSDAIALAVRTGSPIFIEDHVIHEAGIVVPGLSESEAEEPAEAQGIDEERLSVFRDFINNLDLEDPTGENE